jgi:MOSC domain-containing protein YiiM
VRVVSVNTGVAEPILIGCRRAESGINKQPRTGAVQVGRLGLEGDVQVSRKHHGGPDQAVYLYGADDYAWWASELGRDLDHGFFGENLTVDSLGGNSRIGDRLRIGGVLLEVTAPRVPCATLEARVGVRGFVKRFAAAERVGAYARVLEVGSLQAGDTVDFEPAPVGSPSLVSVLRVYTGPDEDRQDAGSLAKILDSPALAERARRDLTTLVGRLAT